MFENRLKGWREDLDLSQNELSERYKIAQTTYSGYECGKYLINTTNLYYLCKTFDISMDYLLGRCDDSKANNDKKVGV